MNQILTYELLQLPSTFLPQQILFINPCSDHHFGLFGFFIAYYLTKDGMGGANFFLLFLCVLGAMSYLTAVLGQFSPKATFKVFIFGLVLELVLLVISLVF